MGVVTGQGLWLALWGYTGSFHFNLAHAAKSRLITLLAWEKVGRERGRVRWKTAEVPNTSNSHEHCPAVVAAGQEVR